MPKKKKPRHRQLQYPTAQLEQDPTPKFLDICWPLAGGLILALVAPYLYDDLLLAPHWVMWLVFPFVVLTRRHDFGLSDQLTAVLPQAILLGQFPIDGILVYLSLRRRAPVTVALTPALGIHATGWFILTMLSLYMK